MEFIGFPHEDKFAGFDSSMWREEIQTVKNWKGKYFEIRSMDASDSFRVIEEFTESVTDTALKEKLLGAIYQKRPFAHFKALVDQSGAYRDKWFKFRDEKMIQWVEEQINGWAAKANGLAALQKAG